MPNTHGDFIWYELMTSDPAAAADFYAAVVGWRSHGFDESMRGYRAFSVGDTDVAGLMETPPEAASSGAKPAWFGYVGVNDVDGASAAIVKDGGTQYMPPTDIPGVGRFAMLADPQGAPFYVMRGASPEVSTSFAMTPGHCQWNELATGDPAAALAFYTGRFGWTKGDSMPMGEGDYQFIAHDGATIGAVMKTSNGRQAAWLFYFGVEDIDAAASAVSSKSGQIHHGPAEVPGGSYIIVASDPQGAQFGLVGPRK